MLVRFHATACAAKAKAVRRRPKALEALKKLGNGFGVGQSCSDSWCCPAHSCSMVDKPTTELPTDQVAETKSVSFLEQLNAATDEDRYEILVALLGSDPKAFKAYPLF
jgi:hypothetical protein